MIPEVREALEAWYQCEVSDSCIWERGAILTLIYSDSLQKTITVSNKEVAGIRRWYAAHSRVS